MDTVFSLLADAPFALILVVYMRQVYNAQKEQQAHQEAVLGRLIEAVEECIARAVIE